MMTFEEILDSEEYRLRFQNCHPIIVKNGAAYHTPSALRARIERMQVALLKTKLPKDVWFYRNAIASSKNWLKQAEWIEGEYGPEIFLTDLAS